METVDSIASGFRDYTNGPIISSSIWCSRRIWYFTGLCLYKNDKLDAQTKLTILGNGIAGFALWAPTTLTSCALITAKKLLNRTLGWAGPEYPMDEIIPGLFLGNINAARSKSVLNEKNVSTVISLITSSHTPPSGTSFICKPIEDFPTSDLLPYLDSLVDLIEKEIAEGKGVLVCCNMGMSRSATVLTAYLMKKYHIPFEKALVFLQEKRACASPNLGFTSQLKGYLAFIDKQAEELAHATPIDWNNLAVTLKTPFKASHLSVSHGVIQESSDLTKLCYRVNNCQKRNRFNFGVTRALWQSYDRIRKIKRADLSQREQHLLDQWIMNIQENGKNTWLYPFKCAALSTD